MSLNTGTLTCFYIQLQSFVGVQHSFFLLQPMEWCKTLCDVILWPAASVKPCWLGQPTHLNWMAILNWTYWGGNGVVIERLYKYYSFRILLLGLLHKRLTSVLWIMGNLHIDKYVQQLHTITVQYIHLAFHQDMRYDHLHLGNLQFPTKKCCLCRKFVLCKDILSISFCTM